MSGGTQLKSVKGGKVDDEFTEATITLRGVVYTIRELDVVQYDECIVAAENPETKVAEYGKLLKAMVLRCVSPSIAARRTPLPFPVYRMLERKVESVHFTDLPDETPKEPAADASTDEANVDAKAADPND